MAEVLDGIAAAGFGWTELGPLGYLPSPLAPQLRSRGLALTAGFVFEPFHDPARRSATARIASRVAAATAGAGGRFLVLLDAVSPERSATAGRGEDAPRLEGARHDALLESLAGAAAAARRHGLVPLVHPHAGTFVEFEDEIAGALAVADLCLDTAHLTYAGIDPAAAYRRWAGRTPYLHLKDLDPARIGPDFWSSVAAHAFRPLGAGTVDFAAFLAALRAHGYDGWATIEQDRPPTSGAAPIADLVTSRRFLEALAPDLVRAASGEQPQRRR